MTRIPLLPLYASAQHANSGYVKTRRETPTLANLGVSSPVFGSSPGPSGAEAAGVILRNCLFIEKSRNTSAPPMAATMRKPRTPGVMLLIEFVVLAATTPNVIGSPSPGSRRTGHPRAARCQQLT